MSDPEVLNAEGQHVPTVAELLTQSRQAHLEYRKWAGTTDREGKILQPYDESKAVPAVEQALAKRLQAHELDPQHADPAWQADQAPHASLVSFYEKFLK